MKEFMFLYFGGDPKWAEAPPEKLQANMAAWTEWFGTLSKKGQLVSGGSPLTYDGKRLTKDGVITDISASELKELVTGYSIIQAESYEQAVEVAQGCPMFRLPGGRVEIRTIVKM